MNFTLIENFIVSLVSPRAETLLAEHEIVSVNMETISFSLRSMATTVERGFQPVG